MCACSKPTTSSAAVLALPPVPTRRTSGHTRCSRAARFGAGLAIADCCRHTPALRSRGVRFRWHDDIRRVPAVGAAVAALRLRGRSAPVDLAFRTWAADHVGAEPADALARSAGILTYHHDPGELSAAFVWEPLVRGLLSAPPTARYPIGGWSAIVERLATVLSAHGVEIRTSELVMELPRAPVIVATELADARRLLGDETLHWLSGNAVCIDLAVRRRRGDPFWSSTFRRRAGWSATPPPTRRSRRRAKS